MCVFQGHHAVRGTRAICTNLNTEVLVYFNCSIKLVNRTFNLYNFDLEIQPNVTVTWLHVLYVRSIRRTPSIILFYFQLKIETYYKYSSTVYKKTLISLEEDVCKLYGKSRSSLFVGSKIVAKENNVDIGCPYKVSKFRFYRSG